MEIKYDTQEQINLEIAKEEVFNPQPEEPNVRSWRQDRIMKKIKPLMKPEWSWLTVGDGKYGSEASWIIANGSQAHASDYSVPLLEIARARGLINDYSRQNAESLSFE